MNYAVKLNSIQFVEYQEPKETDFDVIICKLIIIATSILTIITIL